MSEKSLTELVAQLIADNKQQKQEAAEKLAQEKQEAADRLAILQREATERAEKAAEADQRHRDEMAQILREIQQPRVQQVEYKQQAPGAAEIKADKLQKINFNIRKSNRLKPYKVSTDCDVKLFIKRFDEELVNMKSMVGLAEDLTDREYVPIFRVCLDFAVTERVNQALKTMNKTWENVTKADLLKLMREEFGSRQTDVAEVLKMFGTKRLVKKPDEKVGEFFFKFEQNIPETMNPSDEAGRIEFVDLIKRAMFFISLEDEYIMKALTDLKDPNPNLMKYLEEACAAESRRQSYQEITKSSTSVENSGVTIAKWEVSNKKKNG